MNTENNSTMVLTELNDVSTLKYVEGVANGKSGGIKGIKLNT